MKPDGRNHRHPGRSRDRDPAFRGRTWRDSKGELHRRDGPAEEMEDGGKAWYIHGRYFVSQSGTYESSPMSEYQRADG